MWDTTTEQRQRFSASRCWLTIRWRTERRDGVRKMTTAERKAVVGSPDLESLTTSHIERVFLTVRQELKRYQRKASDIPKTSTRTNTRSRFYWAFTTLCAVTRLSEHRPAVAAGLKEKRWSLERVVEMTETYWKPKWLWLKKEKQWQRQACRGAPFVRFSRFCFPFLNFEIFSALRLWLR